ncbi:MAG: hydantoinase B/oxoprolinase family protein [Desulfobacterales bacterium]|nr:MAG: hydantoinase B/oxoprolinase family protein [Desulfobacterales bacterium]
MIARIEKDTIFASILQCRFKSITEEMGYTLLRTTRSPILNEARDFVTGIYDAKGRMLEQAEYIPVLAFALQPVCQKIIEYFGDAIYPGDVILHNDVFTGGNQNADVAAFKPVFYNNELFAWAAVKGHQADIGGAVAGGYNPGAREIWQEALRITPVKVIEKGKLRRDVWDLIFANIRYPIVEEDIKAQIGSCAVGERLIHSLLERYGIEKLREHIDLLFDSTEKMVRAEIKQIPDGSYEGESWMYYDGIHLGSKFRIKVTITVEGDEIYFDYTGTDGQTEGFANAPLGASVSAIVLTFLMLIDPNIPHNDGLLRPLHIQIPEGTFLNASFPAATTFGNSITGPNSDAILKALSKAIPDRVTAGWNRMLALAVSGMDPRHNRPYVDILFNALKGGSGAIRGFDGYDHIGLINCAGGILAQDPEMFELQTPNTIAKHEYAKDSAGAGQWRGGLGVETVIQFNGVNNKGVVFGDGVDEEARAFGLFGGKAGSINEMEFRFPDGHRHQPQSKELIADIPAGTVLRQVAGGGGGYGEPFLRSAEVVAKEARNGVLSSIKAREEYGVVVCPDTYQVDLKKTERIRGKGLPK